LRLKNPVNPIMETPMMPERTTARRAPLETEVKLVVCAPAPGRVAAAVADLTRIGAYRLAPGRPLQIMDRYFDTPDGALDRRGLGLRLRDQDDRCRVTLKGPSRSERPELTRRMELELFWGAKGLAAILEALSAEGIALPPGAAPGRHEPAAAVLARHGLAPIQERETLRQVRDVFEAESKSIVPLAEMAIDAVAYRWAAGTVGHHEIEIEACPGTGATLLLALAGRLRTRFTPFLQPWAFSKLATGHAVAHLMATEGGAGLLDDAQHLLPPAYDRLRQMMSTDAPPQRSHTP